LIRVAVTKPDATSYLILQGLARVELEETVRRKPYRVERIRPLQAPQGNPDALAELTTKLRALTAQRIQQGVSWTPLAIKSGVSLEETPQLEALAANSLQYFLTYLNQLDEPGQIADLVACTLLPKANERQTVLEHVDLESRLHCVIRLLSAEIQHHKE